jgi:membrane protease YdiL (CAAX protease family)
MAAAALQGALPGVRVLVAAVAAGLLLGGALGGVGLLLAESQAVAALLGEVGLLGGVILVLLAAGHAVPRALRLHHVPRAIYPLAILLGLALLLANLAATVLLGPSLENIEFVTEARSLLERVVLAVVVAAVAPLVEESLFRGLIQGVLERRLHQWVAIVVAGLGFALVHPRPALYFFFAWSLPVGWVTWRTRSIYPAVTVHAVNNLVGLIGLLAASEPEPGALEYGASERWLAALVLAVVGLWAIRLCRRIGEAAARPTGIDARPGGAAETKPVGPPY